MIFYMISIIAGPPIAHPRTKC